MRLLTRGLSDGSALALLSRGLLKRPQIIVVQRKKLVGRITFDKLGGTVWKAK